MQQVIEHLAILFRAAGEILFEYLQGRDVPRSRNVGGERVQNKCAVTERDIYVASPCDVEAPAVTGTLSTPMGVNPDAVTLTLYVPSGKSWKAN